MGKLTLLLKLVEQKGKVKKVLAKQKLKLKWITKMQVTLKENCLLNLCFVLFTNFQKTLI